MAPRTSRRQAARFLAYCNQQLQNPDLTDERREVLASKADFYRRVLVGSCSECGRKLENAESVELGIGPVCRSHDAVSA